MIDTVFILAGGSGTRLWPASRRSRPKQFLPVRGDTTLLDLTLTRAASLTDSGEIYIITIADQLELTAQTCARSKVDHSRIVLVPEPFARNTAPAITVAARKLELEGRQHESVLVLAADHLIDPVDAFARDVQSAAELAAAGHLVTFGIRPDRPDTGYGYVEAGASTGPGRRVTSFKEKPDAVTAERYVDAGNYFWNSGMFAFTVERFLEELEQGEPDVYSAFQRLERVEPPRRLSGIRVSLEGESVRTVYEGSPNISVDYAVMERSSNVAVVEATFEWSDVGSWDEFAEAVPAGSEPMAAVDSDRNYVLSDIPVALCGVEDLIVVERDGALLICKRGASQGVKSIVQELERRGETELL